VVDTIVGDVGDDDVAIMDPEKDDGGGCGESLLEEIDVDKPFLWAERMVLEEDTKDHDDDDHWVIDTYARRWRSTIYEEDNRSIYSQDNSVEQDDDRSVHSRAFSSSTSRRVRSPSRQRA